MKLAVVGNSEFILGFQLAGITKTIEASEDTLADLESIKKDHEVGIVVVQEELLQKLDNNDKLNIEDSVDPVYIPISKESTQEGLRRLIKKSIGVDLWKGD